METPNRPLNQPLPRSLKPKVRLSPGGGYADVLKTVEREDLHTVCKSAHCPNVGECWGERTATFMLLGNICTRACRFCAVQSGRPKELDRKEPERVASAVCKLAIDYAVITSVNRDELEDGGACIFAETVERIRDGSPNTLVELLVPDFCGDLPSLDIVLDAKPNVLNHNVETVARLYPTIQPWSDWDTSLAVLHHAHERGFVTKSGIIVGLGETNDEIYDAIRQVRDAGTDILTIGQYLQPTPNHAPILRMVSQEEFDAFRDYGLEIGFAAVMSGPLVRSSYRAKSAYYAAMEKRGEAVNAPGCSGHAVQTDSEPLVQITPLSE